MMDELYFVTFSWGRPNIVKCEITKETDRTWTLGKTTILAGSSMWGFSGRRINKSDNGRKFTVAYDLTGALEEARKLVRGEVAKTTNQIESLQRELTELSKKDERLSEIQAILPDYSDEQVELALRYAARVDYARYFNPGADTSRIVKSDVPEELLRVVTGEAK